jgi:hypothetical protein
VSARSGAPARRHEPTLEPATGLRVPDFFLVGHAKCGTTALYEMLRRHPAIYMPDVKEPQYLARNPRFDDGSLPENPAEMTGRRPASMEGYLSLFAGARPDQIAGEASTFYIWSAFAPPRIAELQPRARIIAVLREPASFLRSLHLQMLQNGSETEKDLRRALELEPLRREGRALSREAGWPAALFYSDRVRYVEQLQRYRAVLPPEQMLVLIYDDFRADNEGTLRRVLRFLDVDDSVPIEPVRVNPTVAVRSVRLNAATKRLRYSAGPLAGAVRGAVGALTTSGMRQRAYYPVRRRVLMAEPPAASEELMSELRSRYAPEVAALSEYLGRDLLQLWGYRGTAAGGSEQ